MINKFFANSSGIYQGEFEQPDDWSPPNGWVETTKPEDARQVWNNSTRTWSPKPVDVTKPTDAQVMISLLSKKSLVGIPLITEVEFNAEKNRV